MQLSCKACVQQRLMRKALSLHKTACCIAAQLRPAFHCKLGRLHALSEPGARKHLHQGAHTDCWQKPGQRGKQAVCASAAMPPAAGMSSAEADLVQSIHSTPGKMVFYAAGGGAQACSQAKSCLLLLYIPRSCCLPFWQRYIAEHSCQHVVL